MSAGERKTRGRRWTLGLALAGILVLAGTFVWYFRWRQPLPQPPEIDLAGAEEPVAALVESAQAAVRKEPRSAQAWGFLAKVLLANGYDEPADFCLEQAQNLA